LAEHDLARPTGFVAWLAKFQQHHSEQGGISMESTMRIFWKLGLAAMLVATPAIARHDEEVFRRGGLIVSHLWSPETSARSDAVEVFITMSNRGETPERLFSASTPFTADGRFQAPIIVDGILRITEVPSIEIGPGQTITLQRGAATLILADVKRPLTAGNHFEMTLKFATAGELKVEVEFEPTDYDPASKPSM
jgi:periplasmic copper chaperone A